MQEQFDRLAGRSSLSFSDTITVVIPAYDGESLIGHTLHGLRAQRYPDIEVINVDDGSTDDTVRVAQAHRVDIR